MKRFVLAAGLVVAVGRLVSAQPVPTPPAPITPAPGPPAGNVQPPPIHPPSTPPVPPPPVAVQPAVENPSFGAPAPNVFVPPGTPPGPAVPFVKSGGLVVGVYGYYPYDSGQWLLGGTDGLTRQSGAYTMVYPESSGVVGPVSRGGWIHGRTRCGPFGR
ncbi:MAG TPA: hypothetical protein VGE74_00365 [Gemmata sp.]